jgi:hypothetical protein
MKYAMIGSILILSVACNPLSGGNDGSYKSADFNPGLSSVSPTPTAAPLVKTFDLSWTPHYADLDFYETFSGTAGSSIAQSSSLASVIGPSLTVQDNGSTYASAPTASSIALTGQAFPMNGAGQEMNFGHGTPRDFTVMTWMKFSTVSRWGRIISNGANAWLNGWLFQVSPDFDCGHTHDGSLVFGMGAYSGAVVDSAMYRTVNAYNDGQWHHVAMSVQQVSAKKISLYIDGALAPIVKVTNYDSGAACAATDTCGTITGNVADFTGCTQASAGDAWGNTWIGSGRFGGGDYFVGNLAEMAIFKDVALTGSDVSTIYNRQK